MNYYNGLLSTSEVAKMLNVTPMTVLGYVNKGELEAVNLSYGTVKPRYGYKDSDVIFFAEHHKFRKKAILKEATELIEPEKEKKPRKPRVYKSDKKLKELKDEMKKLNERLLEICVEIERLTEEG